MSDLLRIAEDLRLTVPKSSKRKDAMLARGYITLLEAIRTHRDTRGDDRCWDDEELYKVLSEGYTPPARDTTVELERCEQFIASRQHPATVYVSPEREIEQLKEENNALKILLTRSYQNNSTAYDARDAAVKELTRLRALLGEKK